VSINDNEIKLYLCLYCMSPDRGDAELASVKQCDVCGRDILYAYISILTKDDIVNLIRSLSKPLISRRDERI
jgi:hypothetical protein